MASEESAKRFLRLTGYLKNTCEPRSPEHMAKMKAARGPYSDPRDTYIASMIRCAFERSHGNPLSTASWLRRFTIGNFRIQGKAKKSYHYQAIRRALRKVAAPVGRASTRGRSTLWQPIPELLEQRSWLGHANRTRKRQGLPPLE
jgi:hypothetical protein